MAEPAVTQAHGRGLLTFAEAAKLLDLRVTDLLDAVSAGTIECERVNNLPCFSLAALDAYRRRRVA